MTLSIGVRGLVWLALSASILMCGFAQGTATKPKAIEVPEKEMAKHLSKVVPLGPPEGTVARCSNALVELRVTIDENGHVSNAEFSSGFSEFKDSATTAVKQWTYTPYEQHGKPVSVQTTVSIFYLGDGESFPMYSPDGKGGVKGGNTLPMPPGCGGSIGVKKQ